MRHLLLLAGILDPRLQADVDEAVAKGRARLERILREGEDPTKPTPESLRRQADALERSAEASRKEAEGLHKGAARDRIRRLLDSAKTVELEAAKLRKEAQRLQRIMPDPPKPDPSKGLAPTAAFVPYGAGEIALISLALVQSGAKPSDPLLTQAWERIRDSGTFGSGDAKMHQTYGLSVSLMLVDGMMHAPCGERWPPPERKAEVDAWVQKAAGTLAEGCNGGAWTYACGYEVAGARREYEVSGAPIGSDALRKAAVPKGVCDLSNTQYAVLGLKAAALCGARLPDADRLWRLAVQQVLNAQQAAGPRARGWAYIPAGTLAAEKEPVPPEIFTPSMTAAGLTVLLVGRSELALKPPERKWVEDGIRDGLAWLQEGWSRTGLGASKPGELDGYLLYGLERVGVLGDLRTLGTHDWYQEGARALVQTQQADGAWTGGMSTGLTTAFDLLFLSRGTRAAYARSSYEVVGSP